MYNPLNRTKTQGSGWPKPGDPMRTNHRKQRQQKAAHRTNAARTQQPCNICGQPINYQLRHPNPQAWTLEHITPLIHGGNQDDPDNHASAHAQCQWKQGGRLAHQPEPTRYSRQW